MFRSETGESMLKYLSNLQNFLTDYHFVFPITYFKSLVAHEFYSICTIRYLVLDIQ